MRVNRATDESAERQQHSHTIFSALMPFLTIFHRLLLYPSLSPLVALSGIVAADVTPNVKLGSNTKEAVRKLVKALQVELLQALTNFNTEFLQC